MHIYYQIEGQEELRRKLAHMVARGHNLKAPLYDVGNVLLASVAKNFEAQGRPNKWAPLSPKTLLAREAQFVDRAAQTKKYQRAGLRGRGTIIRKAIDVARGHKILQVSGDLSKSISAKVSSTEVRIGSPVPYARIHQLGGTIRSMIIRPKTKKALAFYASAGRMIVAKSVKRPAIKIPARPYLLIQPEDNKQIVRILTDWVVSNE